MRSGSMAAPCMLLGASIAIGSSPFDTTTPPPIIGRTVGLLHYLGRLPTVIVAELKSTYDYTMFKATAILRNYTCRITLFTRANCSLCSDAKQVLSGVWDRRPFEYDEIDVMTQNQEKWKALYEFDTPVVSSWCLYGPPCIMKPSLIYIDPRR